MRLRGYHILVAISSKVVTFTSNDQVLSGCQRKSCTSSVPVASIIIGIEHTSLPESHPLPLRAFSCPVTEQELHGFYGAPMNTKAMFLHTVHFSVDYELMHNVQSLLYPFAAFMHAPYKSPCIPSLWSLLASTPAPQVTYVTLKTSLQLDRV